jgi:DNA-binding transcriptional regulator YbjK
MKTHSKSKCLLALVLAIAIATTGCSSQWINNALQDMPVLTQMALNIATLAATLASGNQASTADVAVIQNISAQASRDLNLLQTLYNQYKANPSASTRQKIQNVISDLNQNLPALLEAAHISSATLTARVTAAVNLILTTVNSFASLIPQSTIPQSTAATSQKTKVSLPRPADLKRQWNQQVCVPTGDAGFDEALNMCAIK